MSGEVLLEVRGLKVHFPVRTGGTVLPRYTMLKAVDGVDFDLATGETLGVVGESGCGKSTLGRAILRLLKRTDGQIVWQGQDLAALDQTAMRRCRRDLQIVFQDPLASLNPRMTVGEIIAEPLLARNPGMSTNEARAEVHKMLQRVGLFPHMVQRYPHEFSGGQCQRISIARAIILKPKLVVLDEPVSALDVSIQAQIINLLKDLQRDFALSYIFISHDLSIVKYMCDRVIVMYLGRIVESAPTRELFRHARHPYTKALIAAVPIPDPKRERMKPRIVLNEDLPSPLNPPSGCHFRTRCRLANALCADVEPQLEEVGPGQRVACHHWREDAAAPLPRRPTSDGRQAPSS